MAALLQGGIDSNLYHTLTFNAQAKDPGGEYLALEDEGIKGEVEAKECEEAESVADLPKKSRLADLLERVVQISADILFIQNAAEKGKTLAEFQDSAFTDMYTVGMCPKGETKSVVAWKSARLDLVNYLVSFGSGCLFDLKDRVTGVYIRACTISLPELPFSADPRVVAYDRRMLTTFIWHAAKDEVGTPPERSCWSCICAPKPITPSLILIGGFIGERREGTRSQELREMGFTQPASRVASATNQLWVSSKFRYTCDERRFLSADQIFRRESARPFEPLKARLRVHDSE